MYFGTEHNKCAHGMRKETKKVDSYQADLPEVPQARIDAENRRRVEARGTPDMRLRPRSPSSVISNPSTRDEA